jgi:hypothetical protein
MEAWELPPESFATLLQALDTLDEALERIILQDIRSAVPLIREARKRIDAVRRLDLPGLGAASPSPP